MGDMMQTVTAFNGVRVSLSWFILNYAKLAEWQATVDRLTQFGEVLGEAPPAKKFLYSRSASPDLHCRTAGFLPRIFTLPFPAGSEQ